MSRSEREQLAAQVVLARLEADGAHDEVEPVVAAELAPRLEVRIEVERGDLDGLERRDVEGRLLGRVLEVVVDEVELAPRAAAEQPVVLVDDLLGDVDVLDAEVLRACAQNFFSLATKRTSTLSMRRCLPFFLSSAFACLGLVGSDEVVRQRLVDDLEAGLDRGRVVGGAVLPEEELEDVDRHVRADLDLADEVLAHDPAREVAVGELVEAVVARAQSRSSSTTIRGRRRRRRAHAEADAGRGVEHFQCGSGTGDEVGRDLHA